MQVGERVDEALRECSKRRGVGAEFLGERLAILDDDSRAAFHYEKRRADDRYVVAEEHAARRGLEDFPEAREHFVLAAHVMAADRERTERRPAPHAFAIAGTEQGGEDRRAAA